MQKNKGARQREMGQMQYSCCNTEPPNGERAVKQWERGKKWLEELHMKTEIILQTLEAPLSRGKVI